MSIRREELSSMDSSISNESSVSAVSWAAILAGAAVAAATSVLLLALGSGLGFASLSPWPQEGPSATTFSVMSAAWLIIMQWLASGLGGYLTGRLRTKWVGAHTHEVLFRDTAHGFVAWAVATVITSIIVAAAASAAVTGSAKAVSSVASGAAQAGASVAAAVPNSSAYEIDSLFRSTSPDAAGPEVRREALTILMKGVSQKELAPADRTYLADLIAARTGITQQEAAQRIDGVIAQLRAAEDKARQLADAARKAASAASIATALSMVIGAFIASVAAALGGGQRDEHP